MGKGTEGTFLPQAGKFAKDGEEPKPHPAMKIDNRKHVDSQ